MTDGAGADDDAVFFELDGAGRVDGEAPAARVASTGVHSAEASGADAVVADTGIMDIDSDVEEVGGIDLFKVDLGDELKPDDTGDVGGADDPERLPRETIGYPILHLPQESELAGRKKKVVEKIEEEATAALRAGDANKAVERYTEAMRMGGSTALNLAMRAALLLRLRRPCAAIRDCTAAVKINSMILKAYRIRGIAHRKLGNWRKSYRDLTQAQSLNFDPDTAAVQKFVGEKLFGKQGGPDVAAKPATPPPVSVPLQRPPPAVVVPPAEPPKLEVFGDTSFAANDKEFDQGQAVVACGLVRAPHLNGKRGVVQRRDPHPSRRGRWEVELRMGDGRVEVVALKGENIMTLNKADKQGCRAWMKEEKQHQLDVKQREQEELDKFRGSAQTPPSKKEEKLEQKQEQAQQQTSEPEERRKTDAPIKPTEEADPTVRLEAKLAVLPIQESARNLLRKLEVEQAFEILEKAERGGSGITNLNAYLTNQSKMALGEDDDSEDEDAADEEEKDIEEDDDPERMPKEAEDFPAIVMPDENAHISDEKFEQMAKAKAEASEAAERSDFVKAIAKYTEAICAGGATALTFAKRAELLLQQRRPCAALRDCLAAVEVNPESGKAYRVRGLAYRALGQWEEAHRDFELSQKLDFDEATVAVQNLVAVKVQERGPTKRPKPRSEPPPAKRSKVP
eukprot:TRINITY_DN63776_c0_g1_i1.p1 TRINITY_DN63776_c0_g1~~TRINITY_DN63776_c0_g1_i1.p1  ORF type:complete len:706 (+),score=161.55 TRINITY_DN63776_c0_g1_i1:74-2119(+)